MLLIITRISEFRTKETQMTTLAFNPLDGKITFQFKGGMNIEIPFNIPEGMLPSAIDSQLQSARVSLNNFDVVLDLTNPRSMVKFNPKTA